MKQDGGSVLTSGSTPTLSPYNLSCQAHMSPFCGSRRSFISSSSVMSAVANISAESRLQDRLPRSEEKVDIDRAALAQKFSVTRRLFETKGMEREEGGGSASKGITGWGSKGMTDSDEKSEEKEWRGAVNQITSHKQEESDNKHESSKNIPLPKLDVQASLTEYHETSTIDGADLSFHEDSQGLHEGLGSTTLDLCLPPEDPLRAELVDVKNESSESDENEEEKVQEETKTMPDIEHGKSTNTGAGEEEQDLVDDVFEESSMENGVALRADESNTMGQWEDHQKESPCETEANAGEHGGGVYWQVNEQWMEQSTQSTEKAEMLTETGECREKDGAGKCPPRENGAMQDEATDQEEEHANEEAKHQDDQAGSTLGCGTEKEAFGNEQESHSPQPEASTPPRQEGDSCVHTKRHLSLEYEEIPGVPEVDDEDPAMVARRTVRFSPAPIKVNKIIVVFTSSCL